MFLPRSCLLLAGTVVVHVLLARTNLGKAVDEPFESKRLIRRGTDRVSENEGRLVNGVEATPHEFPSFIYANGYWTPGCHLSLIRRRWGLTAGHCLGAGRNISNLSAWMVMAGKHNRSVVEEGEQMGHVIQMFQHPLFEDRVFLNDIGLVKFEKPFTLSATVQPVELPPRDYKGLDCLWVVGTINRRCILNTTDPDCNMTLVHGFVQKVDVPIMSDDKCEEYLFPAGLSFNRSMSFCAGYDEGGKDACQGDSGGPTYLVKDGKQIQVGIVSSGRLCAKPKLPGIYTRVAAYVDWIDETIRREEELDPTPEP